MDEHEWLAKQFETYRFRLRAVAYRMLGSLSEADDAVQASWLRLNRSNTSAIENLGGWLTTAVARECLDMLRSRKSRREEPLDAHPCDPRGGAGGSNPEQEALLADSVGLALMVVLDTLNPDERLAFVLHDVFDIPFDEIAPIVGRTASTARQLASRARRRVRGVATVSEAELTHQRQVVEAFLAASRAGDFDALLLLLDPDVVFRADSAATRSGTSTEIHGARAVSETVKGHVRGAQPALVNGSVGVVVAPRGRLRRVACFRIMGGKIVEIDILADPTRLRQLSLAILDG